MRGKTWAAGAAFLLLVAACAPPPNKVAVIASPTPTPSPSPTPAIPLAAAAATFHVGEVGIAYVPVALSATGGVAPYRWAVVSGALPGGLTLGSDGSLSGTPTGGGTFTFTIQVADSGGSSAKIDGKIGVAAPLATSLIPGCQSYCNVELGCVDACGSFGTLGGGVGPYTYSLTQGPLPAGTTLNGLALTGTFKGLAGWLQFTVQVSDALGATSTISPKFWMYPHISFGGGSIPTNPQYPCWWTTAPPTAPGCTASFSYAGGTPGSGTPAVSATWTGYSQTCSPTPTPPASCPAPPMPTVTVSGGTVTISMQPAGRNWINGYKATLVVVLTNQDQCSPGPVNCSASASVQLTQTAG